MKHKAILFDTSETFGRCKDKAFYTIIAIFLFINLIFFKKNIICTPYNPTLPVFRNK
jgi:hypothetical protein